MNRNRHDPQEPMTVLCPILRERVGASGVRHWYGFGSGQKFLLFGNGDGTMRLCSQPLSPVDRAAIPEITSPPSHAQQNHADALRRLAEPLRFVSGLPEQILDPTRRGTGRR